MSLFGPSLMDLVKQKRRGELEAAPDDEPAMDEAAPVEGLGWQMELKRKRRGLLLKRMLNDAGYGELARMVNIKERT